MIQVDPTENKLLIMNEGRSSFSLFSESFGMTKEKVELLAKFYKIPKENIYSDLESCKNILQQEELEIPDKIPEDPFRRFIERVEKPKKKRDSLFSWLDDDDDEEEDDED